MKIERILNCKMVEQKSEINEQSPVTAELQSVSAAQWSSEECCCSLAVVGTMTVRMRASSLAE